MKLHPALALFAVGPVAAILHERAWADRLPERVATHFGANGVPNGWMSRDGATTTYLALLRTASVTQSLSAGVAGGHREGVTRGELGNDGGDDWGG